ncbi:uncharacterized protein KGF55_002381 [Candida pseudojiufengensis]|uniref:uncharacterized protein n=1 Tax=Candida pseudojiufengensis TaxID=497109 RepID=UPI002225A5CD|nr:uncharacterized protein KGF55_002381 [Candida pseudojiufengensis]KAI5963501.1 hypothetical protein KGF55_002381 [Candida pseudojiufengensis]
MEELYDESINNSRLLFQTSKASLYILPFHQTNIKDSTNDYNQHLPEPIDLKNIKECIWRGSVRLIEETVDQLQPSQEKEVDRNIIEPYSQLRVKLEFINIINEDIEKLWGETWFIPTNRTIESELESNSYLFKKYNITNKFIDKVSNDGTDSIKLVRDRGNYNTMNWYRVIVQVPGTGFHPSISPTVDDNNSHQYQQVALLLKFKTNIEAESFSERLDDFTMKFEDQELAYYNDKWHSILSNEDIETSFVNKKPWTKSDSKDLDTKRLTEKYHDMILKEANKIIERKQQKWKNNNTTNDSQTRVLDSSENSSTNSYEEDDFGDFISKE